MLLALAPKEDIGEFNRVVSVPDSAHAAGSEITVRSKGSRRGSRSSRSSRSSGLLASLVIGFGICSGGIGNGGGVSGNSNGGSKEGRSGDSRRKQEGHAASPGEQERVGVAIPWLRVKKLIHMFAELRA